RATTALHLTQESVKPDPEPDLLSRVLLYSDGSESRTNMRLRWFTLPILILSSGLLLAAANKDCIFLKDPDQFKGDVKRSLQARSDLTARVSRYVSRAMLGDQLTVQTLDATTIPHKNFIDDA